ncbi:DNA cytosine methyltransferase [Moraxella sp. FZFQ2102]|uniref:DNA cytosine methyltransferase n=1 Tax=Moraxella sp. FZFQ2102 TaxID=2953752 RepID=UPI00209BF028|nr:DNA cytosine methyltransferase [Moraxella sp. FZFQ2102]USZ15073.1 DNA cytosine methyltransferase [Moraxella sp. FZFQ2102]
MSLKVIDLFAGCGGFSTGFLQNGLEVIKAVEFDKSIAETYQKNHPKTKLIVDDIKNVDNGSFFHLNEADIIIGGPPCQGFSMAGARIRQGFIDDPRNQLFRHYFSIVKTVKPKMFIMENVKGLLTMEKGKIFNEIIEIFSDKSLLDGCRYSLYHTVLKASNYGIPQGRERLFIIGVLDRKINFENELNKTRDIIIQKNPSFFDATTVHDAIANLCGTTEDGKVENPEAVTRYQHYLSSKHKHIFNHNTPNHSKVAIERMQKIGNGENFTVLNEEIKSVHSGAYGRLHWNDIAPTITTRFDTPSGGRFIHPKENRTLTPREAARIQSFPDEFIFYGNKSSICRQIGNAVPPKLGYFWAEFTKLILSEEAST